MKRLFTLYVLAMACAQVHAGQKIAECTVSQILANGKSTTATFSYDGTQQENTLTSTLMTGMKVTLRGSPGSVGNLQAFVLRSIIEDSVTGVASTAESYYMNGNKYSAHFAQVIPGSLLIHLIRPNQDKMEVACFNPQK